MVVVGDSFRHPRMRISSPTARRGKPIGSEGPVPHPHSPSLLLLLFPRRAPNSWAISTPINAHSPESGELTGDVTSQLASKFYARVRARLRIRSHACLFYATNYRRNVPVPELVTTFERREYKRQAGRLRSFLQIFHFSRSRCCRVPLRRLIAGKGDMVRGEPVQTMHKVPPLNNAVQSVSV